MRNIRRKVKKVKGKFLIVTVDISKNKHTPVIGDVTMGLIVSRLNFPILVMDLIFFGKRYLQRRIDILQNQ